MVGTADMDPEGMGAHMGAGASSGKQSVGGRPNTRSLEENCDIMGDHMVKNFLRVNMIVQNLNTLNDNVEIIQERVVNMESNMAAKDKEIEGKIQASGKELEERVDTKMTYLEEWMDAKGAGLEDIIEEKDKWFEDKDKCFEAKDRELEAKTSALEQSLASLESALESKRAANSPAKALAPKKKHQYWNKKDHPELPKNIFFRNSSFGWKKMVNGGDIYEGRLAQHRRGAGGSRAPRHDRDDGESVRLMLSEQFSIKFLYEDLAVL